jgi:mono/diheme cytochrome c family protein
MPFQPLCCPAWLRPYLNLMRRMTILIPVLLLSSGAQAQEGDARKGLTLAREACSDCHIIEQEQARRPSTRAPSFHELAVTPGMTSMALRVALQTSHRTMPNLMFEADEMDNLIAYILSLKGT